jgi:CO/xanthine dehydrogenase Mo-binding subunit
VHDRAAGRHHEHDADTIVNPKTLDGQVIGGTVQLGTAPYEEYLYDEEAGAPATPNPQSRRGDSNPRPLHYE